MSLQVMSVVPLEKGKARIRFDDGTEVVLYKGEIRKLGIEEGCVEKAGPDRASAL